MTPAKHTMPRPDPGLHEMDVAAATQGERSFLVSCFDVATPPDTWAELGAGYAPATRKWLFLRRKYFVERFAGMGLLVIASPMILFLIVLVRVTSPGPAIYRQLRVGYRGKPFHILKIRSMVHDAEKDGKPVWCKTRDPRVTRLGAFLRKVHLDELPQLVNVARGEMALVGPRPERPEIVADLRREIANYEQRLSVMPGVTGLAQINLPPDQTIDDVRRKQFLDLQYIREANGWLDFRMITATSLRLIGFPGTTVMWLLALKRPVPPVIGRPSHLVDRPTDGANPSEHGERATVSGELARV